MAQSKSRKPWERLDNETNAAYTAFEIYRQLPRADRSIRRAAKALQRHPSLIGKWSKKYQWQARVAEWDRAVQHEADKEAFANARRLRRRQLEAWDRALDLGLDIIERILGDARNSSKARGSIRDAVALLREATAFQRLIVGEATERVETSKKLDVSKLSPEEAERLLNLLGKAGYSEAGGENEGAPKLRVVGS